ncbi:hypothetical protein ACEPPN_005689 [Leptodophora sp. 'Broadleaf-Isolate-01']
MQAATEVANKNANRSWTIRFLAIETPKTVHSWTDSSSSRDTNISKVHNGQTVTPGKIPLSTKVTVQLASSAASPPQLRKNNPIEMIEPVLQDAQISYDVKDKVWDALMDESSGWSARLSQLQTVDMDEGLRLFLTEHILADSGA